jgi:intracellular sulfur oxidation DsrE/DsrF family protein
MMYPTNSINMGVVEKKGFQLDTQEGGRETSLYRAIRAIQMLLSLDHPTDAVRVIIGATGVTMMGRDPNDMGKHVSKLNKAKEQSRECQCCLSYSNPPQTQKVICVHIGRTLEEIFDRFRTNGGVSSNYEAQQQMMWTGILAIRFCSPAIQLYVTALSQDRLGRERY